MVRPMRMTGSSPRRMAAYKADRLIPRLSAASGTLSSVLSTDTATFIYLLIYSRKQDIGRYLEKPH